MEGVCNKAMIKWEIINDEMSLGSVHKVCRREAEVFYKFFQKKIYSPEEHRPKYFMVQ